MRAPPGPLAALFVFTCVLEKEQKGAACFLVTWWPGNMGGLLKQAECRCLWCVKWDEERSGASRWRDGAITSSLPTRQPRVVLLCWIECNRPTFFSLTTGACELTSSLPWERNCHGKANASASFFPPFYCPFLFLVCVSVSSCPHFCPVCASSMFGSFILSLSHCV